MKLIIQIPCFNEAQTLPQVIADLPRSIDGVSTIEILVIDDGSTDGTAEVARDLGVEHIVSNSTNIGLAKSFQRGINQCLLAGADIIVNTDGDNQYSGSCIPDLIAPILQEGVDVTIGDRNTGSVLHFSKSKKILQRLGSYVIRYLSDLDIPDAVSGFRGISREAAIRLSILSTFSYTIEMLIQAGNEKMLVKSVPIRTNGKTRDSRLFKTNTQFISRALLTIVKIYTMYKPMRTFFAIASIFTIIGALPIFRYFYFYLAGDSSGHIQSLVLGSMFLLVGFGTFVSGLVAELISMNRIILHDILVKLRQAELENTNNG